MTEIQKRHIEIFNQLPESGRKLIQQFTPDMLNWYRVENGEIVGIETTINTSTVNEIKGITHTVHSRS